MICHAPFKLVVVRPGVLEISGDGWSAAHVVEKSNSRRRTLDAFIAGFHRERLPKPYHSAFFPGFGLSLYKLVTNSEAGRGYTHFLA
jgi:hypothetical protein